MAFLPFISLSHAQQVTTISDSVNITDALILDDQGNLFGADYSGTSVYKIAPDFTVSEFATGFNTPNGIAFDSQGNVFVADNVGNAIYKLSSAGVFLDTFPVTNPSGLLKEIDSDTIIYTTYSTSSLGKLAPDGTLIVTHAGGVLDGPVGLCYDDNGDLYTGNFGNREVYKVFPDSLQYIATVPGTGGAGNQFLGFIAYANGLIYGTSMNAHRIYAVEPNFVDSVFLIAGTTNGTLDGPVTTAQFSSPNGIYPSITGDTIYVSDFSSGNVRMITPGTVSVCDCDAFESLTFFPNPTDDQLNIQGDLVADATVTIEVFDMTGRVIASDAEAFAGGMMNYQLNTADWMSGVYFVTLSSGGQRVTERVVKR